MQRDLYCEFLEIKCAFEICIAAGDFCFLWDDSKRFCGSKTPLCFFDLSKRSQEAKTI